MNESKTLTMADLPPLPKGATIEILESIRKTDIASIQQQHARELDKAHLFHRLQCLGLFMDVGILLTIDGKDIPYVVTRIYPAGHEIHVTKWYFEEPTGGYRSLELVSALQNPDHWNTISRVQGHFGVYQPEK